MNTNQTGRAADEGMATLYGLACSVTLVSMTLTEQFDDLPGAVAALASGWYILRFAPRRDR